MVFLTINMQKYALGYKIFVKKFPNDELADDAIHELNALNSEKNQIELLKNNLK